MNVESNNTTFIHHVLFYLNNPNSIEDRALLIKGLEAMAKIPCIQFSNIGAPAGTTRSVIEKKYSISWLCVFESALEEKVYQDHPIHEEFRNHFEHLWEKVVIYDSVSC